MAELIALVGQNWRLFFIYPGGLSTLAALLLLLACDRRLGALRTASIADLPILTIWLVVIGLLPLPQTGWNYALDLPALLLLIEAPFLLRSLRRRSDQTLVALLNTYPLLALALAALGQSAGTFVVRAINQDPHLIHWLGIGTWAITLPPLLGIGPWRDQFDRDLIHMLRCVAHGGLILAATLPTTDTSPQWFTLVGAAGVLLPLAMLDRWWRVAPPRLLRWQPWLVAALALLLLLLSTQALLARLR